jgi:hypothetical protein
MIIFQNNFQIAGPIRIYKLHGSFSDKRQNEALSSMGTERIFLGEEFGVESA